MKKTICAALMAVACGALHAQAIPIELTTTGDDPVGSRLAFRLREILLNSKQFELTDSLKRSRMELRIVTMALDKDRPNATVYASTFLWTIPDEVAPFYVTQYVGTCGANKLDSCAEELAADAADIYRKRIKP